MLKSRPDSDMTNIDRRTQHGKQMSVIVNAGIFLAATDGWLAAFLLLQRERVTLNVICRVLCEPDLRRPTGYR